MLDKLFKIIEKITPAKYRWILNHDGFKRYLGNTGWMFVARILSLTISFVTMAIIARRLGPENYGQLSYAVSFVSIFSFIATMGLDQVLFRDLIKYPDKKNIFLGSAFVIKLLAGFFAIVLCLTTALIFNDNDVSNVLIFIISTTFLFNAFQIIGYEFQAKVKAKYPSIISLVIVFILSSLKILVILTGKGVIYLALILMLESILYAIFYILIYKIKLKSNILNWKYDKVISHNLIKDSWPIIFASAFALIYTRIDQVIIKQMINVQSVGIYDAAVRISEAWYFIPNIIISSFFPAIVNAKINSEKQYNKRLRGLLLLLIFLSVGAAILVTAFSSTIINILYGNAFFDSIIILEIYIWSGLGMSLSSLLNSYLVAENFRKILFITSFVAMLGNVLLNLILIPKYGIVGSAWATFISYILGPMSLIFFKDMRKKIFEILRLN